MRKDKSEAALPPLRTLSQPILLKNLLFLSANIGTAYCIELPRLFRSLFCSPFFRFPFFKWPASGPTGAIWWSK